MEAERLLEMGVDHIGSVVLDPEKWKIPLLKETVETVRSAGAVSSLIPLYRDPDLIFRTADHYQQDIMHFCDDLIGSIRHLSALDPFISLQERFQNRFPEVRIMRSIPIPESGAADGYPTLEVARVLEPITDLFLTDTLMNNGNGISHNEQPVDGFVGITGVTCDWDMAAKLTTQSRIPVILAGGISPANAYDAAMSIRPAGVDSCTHTNAADPSGNPIRFQKDPDKVRHMIAEVRRAEQDLN